MDAAIITDDTLNLAFSDLAEKLPFDEILRSGKISKEILNFTTNPKEIDILIKKPQKWWQTESILLCTTTLLLKILMFW